MKLNRRGCSVLICSTEKTHGEKLGPMLEICGFNQSAKEKKRLLLPKICCFHYFHVVFMSYDFSCVPTHISSSAVLLWSTVITNHAVGVWGSLYCQWIAKSSVMTATDKHSPAESSCIHGSEWENRDSHTWKFYFTGNIWRMCLVWAQNSRTFSQFYDCLLKKKPSHYSSLKWVSNPPMYEKSTTILYAGMNKSEEKRVKTLERFHQLSFCPK